MTIMKRVISLLLAILMLGLLLTACSKETAGKTQAQKEPDKKPLDEPAEEPAPEVWDGVSPRYGGHINICTTEKPTGLDPLQQIGTWRNQWTSAVYEPF